MDELAIIGDMEEIISHVETYGLWFFYSVFLQVTGKVHYNMKFQFNTTTKTNSNYYCYYYR